jgi:hypothetical protein
VPSFSSAVLPLPLLPLPLAPLPLLLAPATLRSGAAIACDETEN